MRVYTFEVAQHEDHGTLGYKPSWYPAGDPLGGMAVAHDILEHFPGDDGSPEGEYEALGAALFVRADLFRNGTPEENIAADLGEVWGVLLNREDRSFVRPCGLSRDTAILEQARLAVSHWLREWMTGDTDHKPDAETQERVARWIAKGYQRAKVRYRKQGASYIAWQLFQPIQEQADRALKHAEAGMVLTVRVDLEKLAASVSCDYPEERGEQ